MDRQSEIESVSKSTDVPARPPFCLPEALSTSEIFARGSVNYNYPLSKPQQQQHHSSTLIKVKAPAKFFRKHRAKMLALSSSTSSPRFASQRPARLRRLNQNKDAVEGEASSNDHSSDTAKKGTMSSISENTKGKGRKPQLPILTPNQIMIRRLFEKINRAYKASLRESIKQVWRENRETLNSCVTKHHRLQSAMATTSILLSHVLVKSEDIVKASLDSAACKISTAEKVKVVVIPEVADRQGSKVWDRQCLPVTTLGQVIHIPPVLDWTAIPHNLHEDDGKFLTNIPFLGDEFIDKDAKFIDEMVTLYEGKVHEAKDSSSFRKMDDEVLYELVQAMMKIEAEEGPEVFQDDIVEQKPVKENVVNVEAKLEIESTLVKGTTEDDEETKKITFSDIAAKVLQPSIEPPEPDVATIVEIEKTEIDVIDDTVKEKADDDVQEMEIDLEEKKEDQIECPVISVPHTEPETCLVPVHDAEVKPIIDATNMKPSDLIFSILSSTFTGLGSKAEIKERYENTEKVKATPMLSILPNGMEDQTPESYSIPNVEGAFARNLPKEATMHAYHVLFCRRCFTYDCKRHTGDDQVDVKYYKKRHVPLPPTSTSSSISSANTFDFLCKNPDCWQMNDTIPRNPEIILSEWSPSDRSLFTCFIDSFPSNYCFIAYMMRNKSCAQVKEYADIEHVPKTESDRRKPSRAKHKHRKQRMGFNKKSSSYSNNKRNVTRRWINNVKKTEKSKEDGGIKFTGLKLPPRYMPCLHENGEECDSSCTCRINKTSCEKFCTCALTCSYRFPGCKCLSTCDSKRCICFAAARECDPDLCFGCGAHEHKVEKISCHNVNIQRKLHKHLLMGRSDISGWGIYIKNDAQKGEFIAEYRGELISHDESERRGHVYDKIQHTFLFELNDHFVVDATRKGNKARFVNSSKNPNCEVKRMLVNGDHRIGIYAKRFIEAGEELFYDYEDVLEKQQKAAEGANRNRRE